MNSIIQFTSGQFWLGATVLSIVFGVIQFLFAKWITARLEKSIQHEYDKQLEDYRFQHLQRQKAETVALLFAKWIRYPEGEVDKLTEKEKLDYWEELNRMSFEISLWIKDVNTINAIMHRLQNKTDAKNIRDVVGEVRKLILGKTDNFNAQEITLWPKK